MANSKIANDLENEAEVSDLKIRRNAGEISPDTIDFCTSHLDKMVDNFIERKAGAYTDEHKKIVDAIKADPASLILLSTFMDAYEEVVKWNKLIDSKVIPIDATICHREMDIAMFGKLQTLHNKEWIGTIAKLCWNYAHRNG